jgi:hypothetical protein
MQLERMPQLGQVWQDFKNNKYKILFVTGSPIKFLEDLYNVNEDIKHHKTGYKCLLAYKNNKTALIYEHDVCTGNCLEGDYVIYQRMNPKYPQIWACSLDEFLEIISSPYIEDVVCNNYPRFNRVS